MLKNNIFNFNKLGKNVLVKDRDCSGLAKFGFRAVAHWATRSVNLVAQLSVLVAPKNLSQNTEPPHKLGL